MKSVLFTVFMVALLSSCATTRVIKENADPAIQASGQMPTKLLLDVAILPFDPNIPSTEELKESTNTQIIVPDVRRAESRYIAYHLKDTLEATGNWGAVRVMPEESPTVNLTITGKIIVSDGEKLVVQVKAEDVSGRVWLDKEYEDNASKFTYTKSAEEPFQDLYNNIADDLLAFLVNVDEEELARIHQISTLQYARALSPEAFGDYLEEDPDGHVSITKLPAESNPIMKRISRIREQEHFFIDTLDDYYASFYKDIKPSYNEWRFATYEEALKLREMEKRAHNRLLAGVTTILGALSAGPMIGMSALGGGMESIKSGLEHRKDLEIHEKSLKELTQSLGLEITSFVLEIEGRVIELTGTIDDQYEQWRTILREIYKEDVGLPIDQLE